MEKSYAHFMCALVGLYVLAHMVDMGCKMTKEKTKIEIMELKKQVRYLLITVILLGVASILNSMRML